MVNMGKGYLSLMLHGHLPFVLAHGTWPHGADWVFEAAAETYLPLLQILRAAEIERIPIHFTIGVSPVLAEQLRHHIFKYEFSEYLRMKADAAQEDQRYFTQIGDDKRLALAQMWEDFYTKLLHDFEDIDGDIVGELALWQQKNFIEIVTCCATHGYLPLLGTDNSVYAQIAIAKEFHRRHLGVDPMGIWLPEAAYRPRYEWIPPVGDDKEPRLRRGIEEFLYEIGINYFFADSHLLRGGRAIGVYIDRFEALRRLWAQFEAQYKPPEEIPRSPYKPYLCSSTGGKSAVSFFVRDPETGLQVWSGEWGYPGNPAYLDFHKKHFPGGHRYWRVTLAKSDLANKDLYHPEWIASSISEQAEHFVSLCTKLIGEAGEKLDVPPVISAPYDAELFGHWWFEGPRWILEVARKIAKSEYVEMIRGWDYLEKWPPGEVVHLPEGSWGQGGFHYIWLNDWTRWTWEYVYKAEKIMREWANKWVRSRADARLGRVLAQMARELLLLESSDWQFLISTWSARDYAEQRVAFHWEKFIELDNIAQVIERGENPHSGMWRELEMIERQDDIFPQLDPALWSDENLNF